MQRTRSSSARFWADLRAVFNGDEHDLTSGRLGRAVALLAIPMVLEMLMQSIFEVADVFFVAQLGADAVAAVGLTESLIILVFAVGMGLSMAATAVVARRIGEKDPEAAGRAAFQAIAASVAVSIPIAGLGIAFAPEMLALMGGSAAVVEVGTPYCAWLFGTNVVILLLFLNNAIFRGAGDAVVAMRALWLANGINIVLDPALIFGWGPLPAMGVEGAAVASFIGRGTGVAYQFVVMLRGGSRIRLGRAQARVDADVMGRLLRISGPGIVQYLVGTASWLGLYRILATFGSEALAGYTIAIRIIVFALLPSWGLGNAAATLVGQNLGAGRPDRAEQSVWLTAGVNVVFLGAMTLMLLFYAEPLLLLFTDERAVVDVGAACLRIVSYTYILYAFGLVTTQAFNGAGDTATPTWINLAAYWGVQIPLAYALAEPFGMGPDGVFAAIAVAQAVLAALGVVLFRRGTWKLKAV